MTNTDVLLMALVVIEFLRFLSSRTGSQHDYSLHYKNIASEIRQVQCAINNLNHTLKGVENGTFDRC